MTREIPTRIRRLRDEEEAGPDLIAPLAVLGILVALLGTTCLPLWTVLAMLGGNPPATIDAATRPATQEVDLDPAAPGTPPAAAPQIPPITLIGVLVFFVIAAIGIVGGIGTLLRRQWGRRLLLAYAALVLLYLITAIYLRMRFGIEGLTATAPTPSALSLNITCSFGVMLLVAVLMVTILRYFTQARIAARFS